MVQTIPWATPWDVSYMRNPTTYEYQVINRLVASGIADCMARVADAPSENVAVLATIGTGQTVSPFTLE